MSDIEVLFLAVIMLIQGITVGYVLWAPETPFKKGLVDGLSFKVLWGRK